MKTLREKCEVRLQEMKSVRRPYEQDWDEISRLCLPARTEIMGSKAYGFETGSSNNRKRRANTSMYSGKGRRAARILTNGMTSGLSSPSRPWFKLETTDKDMLEFEPVKVWLDEVEGLIYGMFAGSNFYNAVKVGYAELGCFGTEAGVMLEHPSYGLVTHALTAGEYWLANDDGLIADTLYRQTNMSVAQIVDSFVKPAGSWEVASAAVKKAYDKGDYHQLVPVMHAIEPNRDRNPLKIDRANKQYRSIFWEAGQDKKDVLLRSGGFDDKPFFAPRWVEVGGTFVYGDGPGYDALPDLRELQLAAKRRGRAVDLMNKPPMGAPTSLTNTFLSLDPGTIAYAAASDLQMVKPLMETPYQNVAVMREEVNDHANAVMEAFNADLFMAITEMDGVQPRNEQELFMRNEEKLTQLGPIVERVNVEKLEVAIDRAFAILERTGQLPPPPKELEGKPLKVEFISLLTQAQRASQLTSIQRTAQFVGFLAGMFPGAALKFDADQAIDEFATGAGTPPKIVRTDEVVAQMRAQAAQKEQQAQMAAMMPAMQEGAQAAELLSRTNVGGQSMLDRLAGVGA